MPAVGAGLVLFVIGGAFAYFALLPQALPILFSFQSEGLEPLITFKEYFSFVVQLVLAMGLCFEIPLVIMLLTALGVTSPTGLTRFRRFAVVLAAVGGAVLSPGTDILSMLLMTVPILLLYEVGYLGSWVIHRRKARQAAAALVVLLALLAPAALRAQEPTKRPPVLKKPVTAPRAPAATPGPAPPTARRPTPPAPGPARRSIPGPRAAWAFPPRHGTARPRRLGGDGAAQA